MKKGLIILVLAVVVCLSGYLVYRALKSSDPAVSAGTGSLVIPADTGIYSWREDLRTGLVNETGLLSEWPADGPPLVWANYNLPTGFSSVSFGDGTIFITGNDKVNDILIAIDTEGRIKWQTPYGRVWGESYPESRCAPTVEGNRVYVSSGFGDLACIDAGTGSIIWSLKASEVYRGTYGPWGIAESLIIDGHKLYFTPGGPETTTISLDKSDGSLIWKSASIDDAPAYVSPVLIDYAGRKILVNISMKYVFAVDVSDGTILWKVNHIEALESTKAFTNWSGAPYIKCVTPLYHDGHIYVTGGYDHGGMMLKLSGDATDVTVAWTNTLLDVHHGGVVLIDGYIYGSNWLSNSSGNWCCIEWASGKNMWEERWRSKGSVIAADGMLYLYDERSGYVGLVRPNPEKFDLVSSFRITQGSGPHWAHPVLYNGYLYIRHGNALMVYNVNK